MINVDGHKPRKPGVQAVQRCHVYFFCQAWWQSQGSRSSRGSVDYVRGPFLSDLLEQRCFFNRDA